MSGQPEEAPKKIARLNFGCLTRFPLIRLAASAVQLSLSLASVGRPSPASCTIAFAAAGYPFQSLAESLLQLNILVPLQRTESRTFAT
jgi:hypothetical protein